MGDNRGARSLAGRRLYLCVPDRDDLATFVAACIEGGVDVVQLREKHLEAKPLIARARLVGAVCADYGVPFILNDRPDLALEVDADGVHVGQDDAPAALARRLLGPDRIVGLSTHAEEELARAAFEPVDYVSVGPVVETPTKAGRTGTGLGYVGHAQARTRQMGRAGTALPFFVTGGVTPATVGEIAKAGATRFVVVRYLTQSDTPRAAARALRDAIERALEDPQHQS